MILDGAAEVSYAARDLATGHWKNLCVVVWRDAPTMESAEELRQQYLALARTAAGGFFSFGVIEAGVPNPDEQVRKAISAAMDAVERELLGAAVVVEATGFSGAALRAALATMSMLTRSRFPRRFFGTVEDAAAWTVARVPDLGPVSGLITTMADFRART